MLPRYAQLLRSISRDCERLEFRAFQISLVARDRESCEEWRRAAVVDDQGNPRSRSHDEEDAIGKSLNGR